MYERKLRNIRMKKGYIENVVIRKTREMRFHFRQMGEVSDVLCMVCEFGSGDSPCKRDITNSSFCNFPDYIHSSI